MINIVAALSLEAKKLISHYKLKAVVGISPFKIYQNQEISLIISGVGKIAAAAATAYLYAFNGSKHNQVWYNIGIAGHSDYALGTGVLAHKITEESSGKCWYPPLLAKTACTTCEVLTVEKAELDYCEKSLYEMEAAAFYNIASRFSTLELIQCFKIVSDNRSSPIDNFNPQMVPSLIEKNLETIVNLIEQSKKFAQKLSKLEISEAQLEKFYQNWHFSVSQKERLKFLLRRWQTLFVTEVWEQSLLQQKNAKKVLFFLQNKLDSAEVNYD